MSPCVCVEVTRRQTTRTTLWRQRSHYALYHVHTKLCYVRIIRKQNTRDFNGWHHVTMSDCVTWNGVCCCSTCSFKKTLRDSCDLATLFDYIMSSWVMFWGYCASEGKAMPCEKVWVQPTHTWQNGCLTDKTASKSHKSQRKKPVPRVVNVRMGICINTCNDANSFGMLELRIQDYVPALEVYRLQYI